MIAGMKGVKSAAAGVGLIMAMMAAVVPAVVVDARRGAARREAPAPTEAAAPAPAPAADPSLLVRRAVEKGLIELADQSDLWNRVQAGDAPPGFRFDAVYRDPDLGGDYAVLLSSGPLFGQVPITGVARGSTSQVRALRAVYDYFPSASLRDVDCRWDGASPRCP